MANTKKRERLVDSISVSHIALLIWRRFPLYRAYYSSSCHLLQPKKPTERIFVATLRNGTYKGRYEPCLQDWIFPWLCSY